MPPKKPKPNDASDLPSNHVAMPSNYGNINTSTDTHDDPFSYPNVTTMAIAKLKSELNRLQVCIVGNPIKTTLQAKLLTAYQDELLDKVAKFYRNNHNCHYRVLHKSKNKSCVTFIYTRCQVTAPGVVSSPWADYKSCKKIIDNHLPLDMKNNCQSCPGKIVEVITNGTVGLPSFPLPFHLCGNVSSIPIMQLGQQDFHPTFQIISPIVLFKDVFSTENRQAIIAILDKKVKWEKLTGGCKKRFYVSDLASQTEVCKVVERVIKPLIHYV